MQWLKRLRKKATLWLFLRGIGSRARQYEGLTQQTDRAAFLMDHFGRFAVLNLGYGAQSIREMQSIVIDGDPLEEIEVTAWGDPERVFLKDGNLRREPYTEKDLEGIRHNEQSN